MQGGKRTAANGVNAETEYPDMNLLTPPILPYFPKAGRWFRCGLHPQWIQYEQGINFLLAAPICFSRETAITDVGISITAAATTGGVARLGIYENSQPYDVNGTMYPGKLIVDSGEIVTSSIGDKIITLANPITLPAGTIVWLVSLFGGAKPKCWTSFASQNVLGSPGPRAEGGAGYLKDMNYGPLPAIFPSGGWETDRNVAAIKLG